MDVPLQKMHLPCQLVYSSEVVILYTVQEPLMHVGMNVVLSLAIPTHQRILPVALKVVVRS